MAKARGRGLDDEALFTKASSRGQAFPFVLEELADLDPRTKPMFGCTAVYVGERIVMILRDRESHPDDNGVWLATTAEHHASLVREFPAMRSIGVLGGGTTTGWQLLPKASDDFEEAVMRACALVRAGDPRIGKLPNARKPRGGKAAPKPTAEKAPAKKPVAKKSIARKPTAKKPAGKRARQAGPGARRP